MSNIDLQQLLDDAVAKFGVVGAQLGFYDGHAQYDYVTGYRDRERAQQVTSDTLFQIGSTTKVFNAALLIGLVEEGRLDLDTPVVRYIEHFRLSDEGAEQSITLRHLLSMSAGLDNGTYHDYGRGNDALGRYVDGLEGMPHIFAPGSAFGYSNASTNVAGHVAASIMGKTWEGLMTERIFKPLGLKLSALLAEDLLLHPVAMGYRNSASGEKTQRVDSWPSARSMGPAGGLTCCSVGDLVKLGRMFLDHGRSIDGTQVLSSVAIETMQSPQVRLPTRYLADAWCMGPFLKRWGGWNIYGHSGTNSGGSSTLLWCPDKNVAIAVVANVASQGYPLADAIFDMVFPQMFGIEKPAAPALENVERVAVDPRLYVGRFEAFGMSMNFSMESDRLMLNGKIWSNNVTNCELISLGEGRFLPCDPNVAGNRNWDIAFWGDDGHGRASHLLQGAFPLRRTG